MPGQLVRVAARRPKPPKWSPKAQDPKPAGEHALHVDRDVLVDFLELIVGAVPASSIECACSSACDRPSARRPRQLLCAAIVHSRPSSGAIPSRLRGHA